MSTESLVPSETKQVLKLRLTPDDPTVDLNDPAVMEAILKQVSVTRLPVPVQRHSWTRGRMSVEENSKLGSE